MISHKRKKWISDETQPSLTTKTKRPWFIAGGFVVVAAGLTFGATVTAGLLDPSLGLASQSVANVGRADGDHGHGRDDGDANVRQVPCDPNRLIGAITLANSHKGGTLHLAEGCTYVLTANQSGNGLPTITEKIKIEGDHTTIVRAANAAAFRFFTVAAGGELELCDVRLTGGRALGGDGGAILVLSGGLLTVKDSTLDRNTSTGRGGAIANRGATTVDSSTLVENATNGKQSNTSLGGAIASRNGQLAIVDSTLKNNSTLTAGGAVAAEGGVLSMRDTRVSNNTSSGGAGGIYITGSANLTSSSVSNNHASANGGGVALGSTATVDLCDSEVSGNSSDLFGAAIFNLGNLQLEDSKVKTNTARSGGGGIYNVGALVLRRTEVEGNSAFGPNAYAGGILNTGTATLYDSKVTENSSTIAPGGVFNSGQFTLVGKSLIVDNRPTNCLGSTSPVQGCFG